MSKSDYYFSRKRVPGYGNMFFLKRLQEADDPGGGSSLLGTVAEEEYDSFGPIRWGWYPVPQHMTRPSLVTHLLEDRKEDLGIEGEIVLDVAFAAGREGVTFRKGTAFEAGAGPFPSVPANLDLKVDYDRMSEAKVSFGKGTRLHYIPAGYIGRLYDSVDGNDEKLLSSGLIARNNIIDRILVARKFTVSFESEMNFDASFEAKLEAVNQKAGGKVKYTLASKRTVVAEIDSDTRYLVALSERSWDDYDLG